VPDFRLLIDGQLVAGDATMPVINPATGASFTEAPRASLAQLERAVAAARSAFPAWAATPIEQRAASLVAIADRIAPHADELARLLTREQGKPLADARGEIDYAVATFRHFATYRLAPEVIRDDRRGRIEAHRRRLGVVAAIVPWNYPISLFAWKVPLALLAGNTVVVKPAPTTPLTTLRWCELVHDLLPAGVLNSLTDQNDLGPALTSHPDVRKVSFTGSIETGRKVMAAAAPTLKRISLELGGNDAAIVLDDNDPAAIAPKLFGAAFRNNGQLCMALKRLYVHASLYDEICDRLAELADREIVGDGLEQGTTLGPIQNKAQFERVKALLADARASGTIIAGGTFPDGPGYFLRPAVVRDVTDGIRIVDEEQFGPILPVIRFDDDADAVRRANATPFGLGASVWSRNRDRAIALAAGLEAGTIWINQHAAPDWDTPFGGAKQSGIGAELGHEGLNEFTQLTVINAAR
jgi:acyl-CoA reductase-like NAD-dependent aldehyde dehydrogenase